MTRDPVIQGSVAAGESPEPEVERDRPFALTVLIFSAGYVSYFLSKVIFVLCVAPVILLLLPFPAAKYRFLHGVAHGFTAFFARFWLPFLGLYRIAEISGLETALARGPAVYTANHRGFMDSLMMLSLLPRLGILVKSRYAQPWTYAVLARHFDLISIDSRRRDAVNAALESCRRLLQEDKNLLVYPEGSRARSGRLQPFNTLAFELARQAALPVVPVILHSTQPFMARMPGSIFPRRRNVYRIRFLDAEMPRPDDSAESLGDRVRRRMARELQALDARTAWDTRSTADHERNARL